MSYKEEYIAELEKVTARFCKMNRTLESYRYWDIFAHMFGEHCRYLKDMKDEHGKEYYERYLQCIPSFRKKVEELKELQEYVRTLR
jgi:hypothetical protein